MHMKEHETFERMLTMGKDIEISKIRKLCEHNLKKYKDKLFDDDKNIRTEIHKKKTFIHNKQHDMIDATKEISNTFGNIHAYMDEGGFGNDYED